MSVRSYETKAGLRWLYVLDLKPGPDGKRRQSMVRGFVTETAAESAERDAKAAHGAHRPAGDGTVAAELRAWIADCVIDTKPTTAAGYKTKIETYVIPHIGDRKIHALTAQTINALYRTLLERGGRGGRPLAPSSVLSVHKTLSAALRYLDVELKGIRIPKGGDKAGRYGVWDQPQCLRFLKHTRDDRMYAAWVLAIVCGLRRGELAGLRWSRVNLDLGVITINWQRTTIDGGDGSVIEQDTKGEVRPMPIGPSMVSVLTAHRQRQDAERRAAGTKWTSDDDYVFCTRFGRPYYPGSITHMWTDRVADAGMPHIALHDARHSSFTVSSAVPGVDLKSLQNRAGHADPDTLARIYLHAMPAAARVAALAIEDHLLQQAS